MADQRIYVVDIMKEVAAAVNTKLLPILGREVYYDHGRSTQILTRLQNLNDAVKAGTKSAKYPLIALFHDFPQYSSNYQIRVVFPKISIVTGTVLSDFADVRYTKNFKPILYPIFDEFLLQLARHKNVVSTGDPKAFSYVHFDRPGTQPEGSNLNDYLDAIEITNLEVIFKTVRTCKTN